ncbi:MAG: phosphomannomutase/phosphoglucomutase [Patescibacteria group bacterium]|nr:phosphomannomutase/phosphoglucomutase [Patescibacteria group bacterium]MBU2508797.1 phosphomannomutase/phosphoglucomutase [Patescibacteria group bacterium]
MNNLIKHVFRAYDIRGLSPGEIDETFAINLGLSLVKQFGPRKVLVGHDMRVTSTALERGLIQGLISGGADVVRIGLCSTPMFNVIVGLGNGEYDFGVMVTASHNPGKYNGFKMVRGDAFPIGQGSGMEELAEAFQNIDEMEFTPSRKGNVIDDPGALQRYVDHILKLAVLPTDMPKFKIAIDAGNGMAGAILPELLSRLPWLEVIPMYFEPDGTFPNHEANPIKTETLNDLRDMVLNENCDLGIAFDGDADRIGLMDENGKSVSGDLAIAIIGQEVLRSSPGGLVLYDVRSSWAAPEAIEQAGGRSKMCPVGHAFIKRQMREEGATFAGELSMHYYFRDLRYVESGDLVMLYILRRLAREKARLSELWKPLAKYFHSGELNFEVDDKEEIIERIKQVYAAEATQVIDIDGIRMEFRYPDNPEQDWWFNLRTSNTESLIRLNLETRSEKLTYEKIKELTELIRRS